MKRSNERSLGEALGDMIDDLGLRAGLDEQEVIAAWDAVVGPMVARHTGRLMLRGGRLTVKVDSAPLRQELTYQTSVLVERLNGHVGRPVVREVKIT